MSSEDSDKVYNLGDAFMVREMKRKLGYDNKGGEGSAETAIDLKGEAEVIEFEDNSSVCVFCGGDKGIFLYMGKYICSDCYNDLKKKYMK